MQPEAWLLIRHGLAALLVALIAGFGLVFVLIGGVSLSPIPVFFAWAIPGTMAGWRILHLGMLTNGIMAIALGLVLNKVILSAPRARFVAWGTITAVWGNFAFYLFGMFAANRGLTFGANAQGPASVAGALAFVPAIIGAITLMAAVCVLLGAKPSEPR
jgi:hypothetical protein